MSQQKKPRKHGDFKHLAEEAATRKAQSLEKGKEYGGYSPMFHDFSRRILPILLEYDRKNRDTVTLYSYLLAHTNGDPKNDRYMAAFPSVKRIDKETGINKNRIAYLSDVLEAAGMIKTAQDKTASGNNQKLYYPQYYSEVPDHVIRLRMNELTEEYKKGRAKANRDKDYTKIGKVEMKLEGG